MPMPMPCGQDVYASKLFFCRSNSTLVVVVNELITIPFARKHMNFDGFVDLSPNMEPGRMVEDSAADW